MKRRAALLSLSVLALSACGFQLRGTNGRGAIPFKSMFLGAGTTGRLGVELRRYLRANDVVLTATAKEAEAVVDILSERMTRATISLNSQGRVRDYSLNYMVVYRVVDNTGRELVPSSPISLKRDLTFNESQVIAKEKEEDMLQRDMQSDAVQQILRRLSALGPA